TALAVLAADQGSRSPAPTALPSSPPKTDQQMAQALAAYRHGELIEAERLFRGLVEIPNHRFDAKRYLGVIHFQQRPWQDALADFGAALSIRPDDAETWSNHGATLDQLDRRDAALASNTKALSFQPDYAPAHFNRGNVLHKLKRFEEALASYDRAHSLG